MQKNILVITGSARKGSNSSLLAAALIKGLTDKGHSVAVIKAATQKIKPCTGCNKCWSKGRACVFEDDFANLECQLEQADMLVFATPLYWYTFSTYIKALIDKLHAYAMPNKLRILQVKETILLSCCADKTSQSFDGLVATYKSMLSFMGWENRGIIAVPDVLEEYAIQKTDMLKEAECLGNSI